MKQYTALVYEQWRSMRMLFAIAIAVSFMPAMFAYLAILGRNTVLPSDYAAFKTFAIYGLFIAHFFWLCVLLAAPGDDGDLKITMPRFLMRLPVSAWKLAAARLSFGVGSSCILTLAGTLLYYALLDASAETTFLFYSLFVGYATAYVVFQAVTWWVGPAGFVPTITVIIAVIVGVPWISNAVIHYFGFDVHPWFDNFVEDQYATLGISIAAIMSFLVGFDLYAHFGPADKYEYAVLGIAVTVIVSFLTGVAALAQHRKSRFLGLKMVPLRRTRDRSRSSTGSETFASKAEALRWFQHRQQSSLYPKVLGLTFLGFLLLYTSFSFRPYWQAYEFVLPLKDALSIFASDVNGAVTDAIVLGTFLVGFIFMFRGWRSLFKKDAIFLFVRPVTTMELITARWESSAKSVVIGLLPLFGIAAIASLLDIQVITSSGDVHTSFGLLAIHQPVYRILLMGMVAIVYACVVLWAFLWLENVVGMFVVGACVLFSIEGLSALVASESNLFREYVFQFAGAAMFAVLLLLFIADWRNKLVSVKHLLIVLGLAPVLAIGYLAAAYIQAVMLHAPLDQSQLTTALMTMFPLIMMVVVAPIITGPAITQWARHRR